MKTVVCFSGGLDSTVLLAHLQSLGHELVAFNVDYGQRNAPEIVYARTLCELYEVEMVEADINGAFQCFEGSSQTSNIAVPHGKSDDESMKITVVPNRNMILLALAVGLAIARKAGAVAYAAYDGESIYPDCRPAFAAAMHDVLGLCDHNPLILDRPFIGMTKKDIVELGQRLHVPFHLTYSCYEGGDTQCGLCGACTERREAFTLAGIADPTIYAAGGIVEPTTNSPAGNDVYL